MILLLSLALGVSNVARANYEVPPDTQLEVRIGQMPVALAESRLRVLVWNIGKGWEGQNWQQDLAKLSQESDLVMIQEGLLTPAFRETLAASKDFFWHFVTSFMWGGGAAGITVGSKFYVEKTRWYRSPDREPWIGTPKMAQSALIPFNNGQRLLAMNVQGILFRWDEAFREQMRPLIEALDAHQGPALFAGDFNAWSNGRRRFLASELESRGFKEVKFKFFDRALFHLDHAYVRGFKVDSAVLRKDIQSSDHKPLQLILSGP